MIRPSILCVSCILLAVVVSAQPPAVVMPAITPVTIVALDAQKKPVSNGLGFVWDEQTLFCSFQQVKGASFVRVEGSDGAIELSVVLSYSRYFDFVVLRTDGGLVAGNPPGSSDALGVGDPVFVPQRQKDAWTFPRLSVRAWSDSGKGYQLIRTDWPAGAAFEQCPVYNRDGKVVGWMFSRGMALPTRDLDRFVTGRNGMATLSEINAAASLWEPRQLAAGAVAPSVLSSIETRIVRGTVRFPFQIEFPKKWKYQAEVHENMFVVRTWEESMGLCMDLRVMSQQTDDLPAAIERAEILMFSGMARCYLAPHSAQHISGFLACYDSPDPAQHDSIRTFYGMMGTNLYVLTITYPQTWEEQVTPFLKHTLDSLQL